MNRDIDTNNRDREDAAGHGSIRADFSDAEAAEDDGETGGHPRVKMADAEAAEDDGETEAHGRRGGNG